MELARDMKLVGIIDKRYGKSMPRGSRKRMMTIELVRVGIQRATKGLDVSTVGTRWKLMSVSRELRADEVHVVRHARQDRLDGFVVRVAARRLVANELLDPFEVDHRHDADFEVGVHRDVHLRRHHRAVQPLIEKQVGATRQIVPLGERADRGAVLLRVMLVVNVVPRPPAAALAIAAEHFLELGKEVRLARRNG